MFKWSKLFISLLWSGTGLWLEFTFGVLKPHPPHTDTQRSSGAWSNLALGWVGNRKQQMNERKIESVFFPSVLNALPDFLICGGYFSGVMRHSGLQFWMQNRVCWARSSTHSSLHSLHTAAWVSQSCQGFGPPDTSLSISTLARVYLNKNTSNNGLSNI